MEASVRDKIYELFTDCVNRTLSRLANDDTNRPFHAALLSPEVVFWSRFERSFSTSFGQAVIEKISRIICEGSGATESACQKDTLVSLTTVQWDEIETIARESRTGNSGYKPNWENDLERVLVAGRYGTPDTRRVRTDLFWVKDGVENFMSIKTVKPNLDQTAEAKRDLLKIAADDSSRNVYFGLYYNPYGETRESYNFSPPKRLFDFVNDKPILLGADYWNTLGGIGTYELILGIAEDVGMSTRALISGYGIENLARTGVSPADLTITANDLKVNLSTERTRGI
ncbi:TdeIII family type II restriction endonuclease [Glutamicibacter ardleyensis]|uniref:TdeIII family type II restriction endonuclease n=1 Tax=Glutamicibacter ardleyensis TaxID=225894 RepID=UPI003FD4E5D2